MQTFPISSVARTPPGRPRPHSACPRQARPALHSPSPRSPPWPGLSPLLPLRPTSQACSSCLGAFVRATRLGAPSIPLLSLADFHSGFVFGCSCFLRMSLPTSSTGSQPCYMAPSFPLSVSCLRACPHRLEGNPHKGRLPSRLPLLRPRPGTKLGLRPASRLLW